MKERFRDEICLALGASALVDRGTIQSLWSGYGRIARFEVIGGSVESVVVKLVRLPSERNHPRGWDTGLSHERKVKSYAVESAWYESYSARCGEGCRVPQCYCLGAEGDEVMIAMEDLDASGFGERKSKATLEEMDACLGWLAAFHARFMGVDAEGLWRQGTYWHLDTRPDELAVLEDADLKAAAREIDRVLEESRYRTLVHGDAKLANFCFSESGDSVAAVDFQYVGGGCGMKDVAYFIGSCLHDTDCERYEERLLERYFSCLKAALADCGRAVDFGLLEADWRRLFPVAWTDFHRFLKGWSPGHWKVHGYSERLAREVVAGLAR